MLTKFFYFFVARFPVCYSMSSNAIEFKRAADCWQSSRTLGSKWFSPHPEPWSPSKVLTIAAKIRQRLAEYDIWIQGSSKENIRKMAEERNVGIPTIKKDVKSSGLIVESVFKYLDHSKLWVIVILLLVYCQKQKASYIETQLLPELIPHPKIYYKNRVFESRNVLDILDTVFNQQQRVQNGRRFHRNRKIIFPPENKSMYQLLLPSLVSRNQQKDIEYKP